MKNILILSFLYEDSMTLREFEMLRNHYNKIIDYFCFPMKYYGVRATTEGETRIDEKDQIIWLRTDNIEEYDKKLIYKVVDCFRFIEESDIKYDVIIKGNVSTYLNLIRLNREIQKNDDNTILSSMRTFAQKQYTVNFVARGNCLCLLKKHINGIINSNIEEHYKYLKENGQIYDYLFDDLYIASILIDKNEYYVRPLGNCSFNTFLKSRTISNIKDVFSHAATTVKMYNYTKTEECQISMDEVCLRLIIQYVEDTLLFNDSTNSTDTVLSVL